MYIRNSFGSKVRDQKMYKYFLFSVFTHVNILSIGIRNMLYCPALISQLHEFD